MNYIDPRGYNPYQMVAEQLYYELPQVWYQIQNAWYIYGPQISHGAQQGMNWVSQNGAQVWEGAKDSFYSGKEKGEKATEWVKNKISGNSSNGGKDPNKWKDKIVDSADDVVFKQSSLDKAFTKHKGDFGNYPDGSKYSVELFKKDVSKLINTGSRKLGKYRTFEGMHIYNEATKQWTFINSDGTFNTAFKLSDSQFKYLLETGVVK